MGHCDKHSIHLFMIYILEKCEILEFWLSQQTSNPQ